MSFVLIAGYTLLIGWDDGTDMCADCFSYYEWIGLSILFALFALNDGAELAIAGRSTFFNDVNISDLLGWEDAICTDCISISFLSLAPSMDAKLFVFVLAWFLLANFKLLLVLSFAPSDVVQASFYLFALFAYICAI